MIIGIAGDTLLLLALGCALAQPYALYRLRRGDAHYDTLARYASLGQCVCIGLAFALLMLGFALSDFSLAIVAAHSHSAKPFLYKLTATWAHHEGSMLLWALVLALFGAAAQRSAYLRTPMLAAQGALAAGLLLYILFTSSPFTELYPAPAEGQGLNPILQDIGLALHPPMLYLGYVGCGIVFAYALAGLACRRFDAEWARALHRWIAISWAFLTFGIGLGSWWAYRELGWGGWWFWDPVENVSLLPWLTGTALLHANRVLMQSGRAAAWVALLAILTFAMSLIGTFIVRSGLLVSVHSFASDPSRGLFLLLYLTLSVGAALWLFVRQDATAPPAQPRPPRHALMLLGNVFLIAAALTILLAILYPLVMQALGRPSITVGPPYFNQTVLPLMAPAALLAGCAALTKRRIVPLALAAIVAFLIALALIDRQPLLTAGGLALGAWLAIGTALAARSGKARWPMVLGHGGLALFILCLTVEGLQKQTFETILSPGDSAVLGSYRLTFRDQTLGTRENYGYRRAVVEIEDARGNLATVEPELRFYPVRDMHTAEPAIASTPWRDWYLSAALQPQPDRLAFTLHVNPAQQGIWLAFLLAGAAGLIAWRVAKPADTAAKSC